MALAVVASDRPTRRNASDGTAVVPARGLCEYHDGMFDDLDTSF
jgi:hypothetical protein